jgi:hypothetical protein
MPAATTWKTPPIAKVYEALGAIGDDRVKLIDARRALVKSSDGRKTYEVETSIDGREISSNDNASYWQGYLGYPAIAALLARGFYRAMGMADVCAALKGIPWKELNLKFRNDYAKTLTEVDRRAAAAGHDPDAIRAQAEAVLAFIRKLSPHRGKRSRPPAERSVARLRR